MKKITITFVIATLVVFLIDIALQFAPIDRAGHGEILARANIALLTLPNIILAVMLFLHYRKEGTLQERLHQRYICYLLLFVVLIPLLGWMLRRGDLFSDIHSIIANIAITCIACDFCKYRQPAKWKPIRFAFYLLLAVSIIGILFIPVPTNMYFTYGAKLIILYVVISLIIDACRSKQPYRFWIIAASLCSPKLYIPAYLLETTHSELEN